MWISAILIGIGDGDEGRRDVVRQKTAEYLMYAEELHKRHLDNSGTDSDRWKQKQVPRSVARLKAGLAELANYKVIVTSHCDVHYCLLMWHGFRDHHCGWSLIVWYFLWQVLGLVSDNMLAIDKVSNQTGVVKVRAVVSLWTEPSSWQSETAGEVLTGTAKERWLGRQLAVQACDPHQMQSDGETAPLLWDRVHSLSASWILQWWVQTTLLTGVVIAWSGFRFFFETLGIKKFVL